MAYYIVVQFIDELQFIPAERTIRLYITPTRARYLTNIITVRLRSGAERKQSKSNNMYRHFSSKFVNDDVLNVFSRSVTRVNRGIAAGACT